MLPNKGMRRMWELKPVEIGSTLKTIYWDGTTAASGQNIVGVCNGRECWLDGWDTTLRIVYMDDGSVVNLGTEKGIYDVSTLIIERFENPDGGLQNHIWGAH